MLLNLSLTTKTSIVHKNDFVNRKNKKITKKFWVGFWEEFTVYFLCEFIERDCKRYANKVWYKYSDYKFKSNVRETWCVIFGQRSWHIPIRITAHPRGAFISVGDWTPTETNLLLLATWRGGSLLDWDKPQSLVNYKEPSLLKIEGFLQPRVCSYTFIISA